MNPKDKQRSDIIDSINKAVRKNKNNTITISFDNMKLSGISYAKRYFNKNLNSYSDIIISPKNSKDIYLSMKMENLSSSSDKNFRELDSISPGLSSRFIKACSDKLTEMDINPGDRVPNLYGKIPNDIKESIVIGTKTVGGPIDYVYEGKTRTSYDEEKNVLSITGSLISARQYAKSVDLYLHLLPKRDDQKFDPTIKQGGLSKIYGKSSRGDDDVIIEITENIPKNATLVKV